LRGNFAKLIHDTPAWKSIDIAANVPRDLTVKMREFAFAAVNRAATERRCRTNVLAVVAGATHQRSVDDFVSVIDTQQRESSAPRNMPF
jgi:hypothetical protein